jgi:uncharacterized membrane protein HdeD (DUF308 family)
MDWSSFGKRLTILFVICLLVAWVATVLIFLIWTPSGYFTILMFMGLILLIFGACLQTPFIEAIATGRYAVNPPVTRDTARHYSERRAAQERSGVVILATGVLLLAIGLLGLFLLPSLPV